MLLKDPLIGQQLANYRIEKLLGHGGMAKVYLGWDVTLQRSVAIKVIDERFRDDSNYSERFLREARTMATWKHPNIPQVYNAGEEEGVLFFAMEYIRGQNLAQLLRQRLALGELLSYAEVLQIGRAVAEALDYAHQTGVVHRDVTPSNVVLGEDGRVILMDFGLALDVTHGTRGEVFGTPHYIAPEQVRSSAEAVPQTDLYALGVMLYEMLTGVVPFDDPSPASLAHKHITDEPPPPSKINPEIGSRVEAVLLTALRKDPGKRYQSGKQLMEALEEALYIDSQPATIAELPAKPNAYPVSTLAEIPAMRKSRPRPDNLSPASQVTEGDGYKPGLQRTRYLLLGGLGCGLLVLICSALLVRGALSVLGQQSSPTTTRQVNPIVMTMSAHAPTRTATSSPTPTTALTQSPTATSSPTPTITPTITPTPTPTSTSTPTPTPTPTSTSTPWVIYELLIVGNKDDSLFVVNEGEDRFPLVPLEFKNIAGGVLGKEWKVEFLETGDCVAVWKKEGNPKAPKDLKCKEVGERLTRSGSQKFWLMEFDIYYQGKKIESCAPLRIECSTLIEIIDR
jgi:serine/threonine protein kinase